MLKPKNLVKGDKVAIVSLSRGLLGMPFCKHELDLGTKRLKDMGLEVVFMPNALKDMDYVESHPEARAEDLKTAILDKTIKGIICAIGGNDTYKTIPFLMDDPEFVEGVKNNPKIFIGFSDTTNNHLMFSKLGLNTFYGPCFMVDIAELDKKMLPYTLDSFNKLFDAPDNYEITSSDVWYEDRKSYGPEELNKPRVSHEETHGYEVLNGGGCVSGKLYGGCIESLYDAMCGNAKETYEKYNILPTLDEWKEKILFIETSEEHLEPEGLEKILNEFKDRQILQNVKGVIVGKPIDESFYEEYKEVYKRVLTGINTPVLYNVNFGHAVPRCLLPYNCEATVDYDNKQIFINENILEHTKKN